MRRPFLGLLAALLTVWSASAAHALYMRYGKADPAHPISASFWPKGAAELANRPERFGGYMLNAFDRFHYAGDARAFNEFLKAYARVEGGTPTVTLFDGKGGADILSPRLQGADWEMSISSNGFAGVSFSTDARIKLSDVKVPLEVNVDAYPDAGPEVKAFIAAHEAAQKRAWTK